MEERDRLFRVEDAVRLDDRRIVVANSGKGELLYFDPEGELETVAGGLGGGPGEFREQGLSALTRLAGDSILAYGAWARRVSLFGPDGQLARTLVLEGTSPGLAKFIVPVGWLSGRRFVGSAQRIRSQSANTGETESARTTVSLVFFAPDGTLYETAGEFPGTEMVLITAGESAGGEGMTARSLPTPFRTRFMSSSSDSFVAAGSTGEYEIEIYDDQGDLSRIIRSPGNGREVDEALLDRWIARRLRDVEDPASRDRLERQYRKLPVPDSTPVFEDLLFDAGGRLWVREYVAPGQKREHVPWTVFGRQGRRLGQVELPRDLEPFEIGSDYVLGLWKDELDVERVRLYRLSKPKIDENRTHVTGGRP